MTIEKFIDFIREFKKYEEPKSIKVIVGLSEYFKPIQKYEVIDNKIIDIYKHFEYFAFTLNNQCDYKGSDTSIWRILLNNKILPKNLFYQMKCNNSKKEFKQLSVLKLIYFLYFHEGIVMINRNVDRRKFEIFKKYNVTDVLFVGKSMPYKSLTKFFKDARFGLIYHPSKLTGEKGNWFYDTLDPSAIQEVSYYKQKYRKTNFKNFSISCFK